MDENQLEHSKKTLWQRIKALVHRYERHISTVAFIAGFALDNIMLNRIDTLIDNLVLARYLLTALACILLYNALDTRFSRSHSSSRFIDWLPIVIQFSFGALFSGFFVFYSRSASLFSSWPFLIFLLALLFGNEYVRHHYSKLTFQIAIFFIVTFSYSIFLLPILLHSMGPLEFILSGIISLTLIGIVLYLLYRSTPERYFKSRPFMLGSIIFIYIAFNVLYFKNIIPPIPLSLKEIGVYHSVTHTADGNYQTQSEDIPFYNIRERLEPTFHQRPDESVYVYSRVFAPTKLNVTLFYEWSYFDPTTMRWIVTNQVPYPITGGGSNGYRGYSFKSNIFPGKWRVDVVTERKQLLGRLVFSVIGTESEVLLKEKIR